MIIRNNRTALPRPLNTGTKPKPTTIARPRPAASAAARNLTRDSFSTSASPVRSTARVAAAPAGDHGKLMNAYLTGARRPPADFEKVMGYKPYLIQTKHGPRMQDPHGYASAPGKIGPVKEFDKAAKTHDYGYDLLRYHARKGTPLGPEARKAADALFRKDLFNYANDQKGLKDRWKYRAWAQTYATAVELNSRVQGYKAP
jgi:hypothetical protein